MNWTAIAAGLIPSIGVGLLFWFVMRAVVRADRNERAALARYDAEHAAAEADAERAAAGADADAEHVSATPEDNDPNEGD